MERSMIKLGIPVVLKGVVSSALSFPNTQCSHGWGNEARRDPEDVLSMIPESGIDLDLIC